MTNDEHAWANPALRAQILSDPAAVLRDRGVNPPAELPLSVLHEFIRVAYLLWVEGKILPVDRFAIDPSDEGLLFGRGAWESTRTVNGLPWLWPLHIDRLVETCKHLHIEVEPNRLPNADEIREYVRAMTTTQDVIVRLNVTAGRPGHRGVVWMSAAAQPKPVASLKLLTRRSPVEKGDPYLTLKTFQYASRLRIGQDAAAQGYHSALLVDGEGNLLEASHANLFVKLATGWATPTADGGFLPGTVRRHLLNHSPVPIRQEKIPLTALKEAKELFVTNSGVGIIPVTQIDKMTYPIGDDTKTLTAWLQPPAMAGTQYRFVERGPTVR